jgi:hypothetical protein
MGWWRAFDLQFSSPVDETGKSDALVGLLELDKYLHFESHSNTFKSAHICPVSKDQPRRTDLFSFIACVRLFHFGHFLLSFERPFLPLSISLILLPFRLFFSSHLVAMHWIPDKEVKIDESGDFEGRRRQGERKGGKGERAETNRRSYGGKPRGVAGRQAEKGMPSRTLSLWLYS